MFLRASYIGYRWLNTFEDLGVTAYTSADQLLEKGEYLLLAGKIVSVEARHATAIRYLIGMKGSANASAGNSGTTVGTNASNAGSNSPDVVNEKGLDQALMPAAVPFARSAVTT
jgi:hypothetical protein